jgi:hypothetical protein
VFVFDRGSTDITEKSPEDQPGFQIDSMITKGLLLGAWKYNNSPPVSSKAECGRRGGNYFLFGSDCCPNRPENNLNHPESFLLEREDILSLSETFLRAFETFLSLLEMFQRQPEDILQHRENLLNDRKYILSFRDIFWRI